MAAGLPCIGTTADAAAEIIVDGHTGLIVPPQDSLALGAAVARLLVDRIYSTRLGNAGRVRAERDYNYTRFRGRLQTALSPLATYPRMKPTVYA
jgi:glycosyltransferase involved in cell wall biosynthesis